MTPEPFVVVQVLLYNESIETIDRLLHSLEQVEYDRQRWMLVIVNNQANGHPIAAYLEQTWRAKMGVTLPQTVVQEQRNNGFAGGHNSAFAISKTFHPDFVYLLNGDARVHPDFLRAAVNEALGNPQAGIVQSTIMLGQDPQKVNAIGNCLHYLGFGFSDGSGQMAVEAFASKRPHFYASGAGVLIRVSMLEQIGGLFYDDQFMYHEDVDLSWRARLSGFQILFARESLVYHYYEFSKSIKKFYWLERNRHLINVINFRFRTLLLFLPMLVLMEVGTMVYAIRSGWVKEKLRSWWYFWLPSTWALVWRRRRVVQARRTVSDAELLPLMVKKIEGQEIENWMMRLVVNPLLDRYATLVIPWVRW